MGLSHPLASKVVERYGNDSCRVASCSMQGYRLSMEDAHRVVMNLKPHAGVTFLGVFDGHGGAEASKWCASDLHTRVAGISDFEPSTLKRIVRECDAEFLKDSNQSRSHGSTCVFALLQYHSPPAGLHLNAESDENPANYTYTLTVSNSGDSRCVWGTLREGAQTNWIQCTEDHKPTDPVERNRIEKAEGFVSSGRVDGDLSVSRAIGDSQFKSDPKLDLFEQKVSPEPDITSFGVQPEDWILLACDGIFERLDTSDVANFITNSLREHGDPSKTVQELCDYSLNAGSKDNMTVVLVYLKSGTEYIASEENRQPQFIPGDIYPDDSGFVNAYNNFAVQNGFPDQALEVQHDSDSSNTNPPILKLIAQLAQENQIEILEADSDSVITPEESSDSQDS